MSRPSCASGRCPSRTSTTTGRSTWWAVNRALGALRGLLATLGAGLALAADGPLLTPLTGPGADPPAPWHVVGLPRQSKPLTRFTVGDIDGKRALRVETDHAYGNLVHALPNVAPGVLSWRWRVDQPVAGADLKKRASDDAALKVCAFFALPDSSLPFIERQMLRFAEARAGEHLPSATLCYVWHDGELPHGAILHNAYTHRVRFIVLRHTARERWSEERHDLAADFVRAFGDEARSAPPLEGIAIGADSDNTGSRSLAWIEGLNLAAPTR